MAFTMKRMAFGGAWLYIDPITLGGSTGTLTFHEAVNQVSRSLFDSHISYLFFRH
jgi:hypothetical protein